MLLLYALTILHFLSAAQDNLFSHNAAQENQKVKHPWIRVNGIPSVWWPVMCGVPCSSILESVLTSVCINYL